MNTQQSPAATLETLHAAREIRLLTEGPSSAGLFWLTHLGWKVG